MIYTLQMRIICTCLYNSYMYNMLTPITCIYRSSHGQRYVLLKSNIIPKSRRDNGDFIISICIQYSRLPWGPKKMFSAFSESI